MNEDKMICKTCKGTNKCNYSYPVVGVLPDGDAVVTFPEAPLSGYLRVQIERKNWRGKKYVYGYSFKDTAYTKHRVHADEQCLFIGRHFVIPSRNAKNLIKDVKKYEELEFLAPSHGTYLRVKCRSNDWEWLSEAERPERGMKK